MSGRPNLRVLTAGVLTLVLALGGPAATSFADETEPTATPTSTEVVEPTTTTEPAPTSTTEPSTPGPVEPEPPQTVTPNPPVTIEPVPTPTGPWGGPAPIEEPAAQADLKVTVTFKQTEYLPDSNLEATVTVENVGDAAVENLQSNYDGDIWLTSGYQELQALSGTRFEPGQKKVIEVVGRQRDARAPVASFRVRAFQNGILDPTPQDNESTAIASVPQKRGSVSGTVYADANGNGQLDAGESVAGVEVHTYGGLPNSSYSAVTDAAGRFGFTDVPTGGYTVHFQGGDGVVVKPGSSHFAVEEGTNTDLALAAVRPVADVLSAKVELDRESYGRGDPINVKITLTNTGAEPLNGVVAVCNHEGSRAVLSGTGPGWAPLVWTGPGTSLAAGETKVIDIPDVVPDEAFNLGSVAAECNFGNNGQQDFGYVGASDRADVVGAVGDSTGVLFHDLNNDHRPDGEGLAGVTMVALHPKTRAVVARTVTGADGEWAFRGLPVGSLPVIVVGKWKDRYGSSEFQLWVRGGSESRSFFSVVPGPDVLDPAPTPAELEASVTLDKTSYYSGEAVKATLTIKNTGGTASKAVRAGTSGGSGLFVDYDSWGDLNYNKPGVVIQPGGVHVAQLTGRADTRWSQVRDRLTLKGQLYTAAPDGNWNNDFFEATAAVTFGTGSVAYTVYSDANGNGQVDAGEGVSGVRVRMSGPRWGIGGREYEATTGADGKVVLADLPSGAYGTYYTSEAGWLVPYDRTLEIEPGKQLEVVRKAKRPLSDTLLASVKFDQDTYAPGDTVNLTVTVTNNGAAIPVVQTLCSGSGEPFELYNFAGDGWGPLKYGGPGFSLAGGETKIFHVSAPLPTGAPNYGFVTAACVFGPQLGGDEGSPMAHARANIPGLTAGAVGRVLHDHDGEWRTEGQPVANTKIVLIAKDTGKWAASTVTDSTGKYEFKNVPVGNYDPVVVGPWKLADGMDTRIRVIHGRAHPHDLWVVPGPEVADPEPVTPPAAQGGGAAPVAKNPLATTGASVAGLSALGIGLLLAGAGSLTAVRRRRGAAV